MAKTTGVDADSIAEFYTRHPYPPPVGNLDRARDEWRDPARHRADFHLFWAHQPYRASLDILVAGCGTWQSAKYALCRPDADVVGIDVSPTSIDCTDRLKQRYGLTNLRLEQLALEHAGRLQRQFDLIVCTGVLHHLEDPDAGLAALRSVLKPDGAIYLMVYAPYGRAGIYMLQEYCRRLGIGTSDADLRDLLATLKTLPAPHPLSAVLRSSRDAGHADALADALLNPRDRSYSVPQLFDLVDRGGMRVERWHRQAPYLPTCGSMASTPHAARLAALPPREQYAAMELWRGSMTAHSAILRRDDADECAVTFDDERGPAYVPIRLPWTVLIRERLPAGAAGVLINRNHPFTDLVLVLDARDARVFEQIDGRRSIADICERASVGLREARTLFEKLWRYDQVVFDASMTTPAIDRA